MLSLDEVGAATRTSRSQLFHYFPEGKRALLRAVFEHEVSELNAAQEPALADLSTPEAWLAWRDGLRKYYLSEGRWSCPLVVLAASASIEDPSLAAWLARGTAEWREQIASGVAKIHGHETVEPDDTRIAVAMVCQLQGALILGQIDQNPEALIASLHQLLTWLPA